MGGLLTHPRQQKQESVTVSSVRRVVASSHLSPPSTSSPSPPTPNRRGARLTRQPAPPPPGRHQGKSPTTTNNYDTNNLDSHDNCDSAQSPPPRYPLTISTKHLSTLATSQPCFFATTTSAPLYPFDNNKPLIKSL